MQKSWVKKGLVCGIIILFVGASVIPVISGNIGNSTNAKDVDGQTAGVGEKTQVNPNGGARPLGWDTIATGLVYPSVDTATDVDMAVDYQGTVHFVWVDLSPLGPPDYQSERYDIFYITRSISGSWSSVELVSSESDRHTIGGGMHSVSLALENRYPDVWVHVAWVDESSISSYQIPCFNTDSQ